MCLPKGQKARCGEKTESMASCCCQTSKCNDDAFVAACTKKSNGGSGSVSLAPVAVVTVFLMVVAAVFSH